jgi:branched-chain amino acid transport system ATP-binding protein
MRSKTTPRWHGHTLGLDMSEALLSVSNLEAYYGPVMAVRGVSFNVMHGQITTILGANGAGKSTVLKVVSGAMDPDKGTIMFDGRTVIGQSPERMVRRGISHVPEGREIFPFLTVRQNLEMGAFTRRDRTATASDMNLVLGYFPSLERRLDVPAAGLSGGEQQMLAIGRALMARPKMLLLDEPSLGLSPKLVSDIFSIIRRINQERKTTILLIEQNARVALDVSHFGYVMEVGRIVMADSCKNLVENKDVKEFYLGMKEKGVRGSRRWKKRKTWR